jgi:hypothetical protein
MGLCQDLAALWPVEEQDTSQAVCMGESGGDPNAHCLNCTGVVEDSRCAYQVNVRAHPEFDADMLWDPTYCGQAALTVWRIQGWRAWGAYTNGSYRAFLQGGPVVVDPGPPPAPAPSGGSAAVVTTGTPIWPFVVVGAAVFALLGGGR